MSLTEEQIRDKIGPYEVFNKPASELAESREPCEEKDCIKIVASGLGVGNEEVEFPPDVVSRESSNNLPEGNFIIPVDKDKGKGKGKGRDDAA